MLRYSKHSQNGLDGLCQIGSKAPAARQANRSVALLSVRALEAERNGECQSGADFIDGVSVGERVAKSDVEGEFVADLPDQADQPRNNLLETELFLIKDLRDR